MALEVRRVLKMACDEAARMGLLGTNPVTTGRTVRPTKRDRRRWTADEASSFVRATGLGRYHPLWKFLLGTGLRVGEALGLEWDDVAADASLISVRRAVAWVGSRSVLGPPKTESSVREVSLPGVAALALSNARVLQAEDRLACGGDWFDDRGAAFTTSLGGPPSSGVLWRAFQRDCRDAGVPEMRIHDLRHVHATLAVSAGADPKTVQARLGHASLSLTLDVYTHRVAENDRILADAFGKLIG